MGHEVIWGGEENIHSSVSVSVSVCSWRTGQRVPTPLQHPMVTFEVGRTPTADETQEGPAGPTKFGGEEPPRGLDLVFVVALRLLHRVLPRGLAALSHSKVLSPTSPAGDSRFSGKNHFQRHPGAGQSSPGATGFPSWFPSGPSNGFPQDSLLPSTAELLPSAEMSSQLSLPTVLSHLRVKTFCC